MCGQCVLHSTGLTCPMNCPKTLRNGPCGGVRADGHCEVKPEMRCVWLKAYERSERLPLWRGHIDDLRPPRRQRAQGHLVVAQPDQRARPPGAAGWDWAAGGRGCRTLSASSPRGEFVVTAELPVIDGGGHAEIARQLEPMRPFVDAFNATDNPSAHAHCSPLAVSIGCSRPGSSRSCS